jgi:hypothetical protein
LCCIIYGFPEVTFQENDKIMSFIFQLVLVESAHGTCSKTMREMERGGEPTAHAALCFGQFTVSSCKNDDERVL